MNRKPYGTGWVCFSALVVLGALPVTAQGQVPERHLDEADAVFPESFSTISGLRELRDGRLLIADALGQALMVVDLTAGVADTIGRVGAGPGEYDQPDGVFPLPGDSTLLVDLGNGRLTVMGPDLSFGETTPIAQGEFSPGTGGGGLMIVMPRATDSRGGVYFQAMGGFGRGGPPDSTAVVRWDRGTGAMDTVAMIKRLEFKVQTSGSAGSRNMNMMMTPIPYSPQDGWGAGWNGTVAAARSGGYYLEWIGADGQRTRSDTVSYRPVRIRQAEKEEYVDRLSSGGLQVRMGIDNGVVQASFSRGGGGIRRDTDGYEWPDTKQGFVATGVFVTPEGDAWVERSVPAGANPVFDVFDANGQLKEQVILPAGRRIVGFGAAHVYVSAADDFDLQWLERYRRTT